MKRLKSHSILILFSLLCISVTDLYAQKNTCLKVKIFSSSKTIRFSDKGKFVLHFQMDNCGNYSIPLDFYANIGYPKDSTCNIYFEIMRTANKDGRYEYYNYDTVDYKNVVDSLIWLRSGKIYTFYLPLFQLYGIREPGNYRLQGFYRFITESGDYYIQKSDYFDVVVK